METVHDILIQSKALLERHYGVRFKGLVLYGSSARNEAGPPKCDIELMADWDLAVSGQQPYKIEPLR